MCSIFSSEERERQSRVGADEIYCTCDTAAETDYYQT